MYKTLQEIGAVKISKKDHPNGWHILDKARRMKSNEKFAKWLVSLPELGKTGYRYLIVDDIDFGGEEITIVDPAAKLGKEGWWEGHSDNWGATMRGLIAGTLRLTDFNRADKIDGAVMSPRFQGRGLMLAMYIELITELDRILVSDSSQSEGGMILWRRLAKEPGIFVYGYDEENGNVFHVFDRQDDLGWDGEGETTHQHTADDKAHVRMIERMQRQLDRLVRKAQHQPSEELTREITSATKELAALEDEWDQMSRARFNYLLVAVKGRKPRAIK